MEEQKLMKNDFRKYFFDKIKAFRDKISRSFCILNNALNHNSSLN